MAAGFSAGSRNSRSDEKENSPVSSGGGPVASPGARLAWGAAPVVRGVLRLAVNPLCRFAIDRRHGSQSSRWTRMLSAAAGSSCPAK